MKRCEHIFHLYDEDESGAFDKEEFKTLWGVLRFNSSQNTKAMRRSVKREGRIVTHVSVLCRQVSNDEIDRVFQRFDMDRDGLLNMTEFINCIKRELSRKTGTRREEIFTLLERGMDGGKRLMSKNIELSDDEVACLPQTQTLPLVPCARIPDATLNPKPTLELTSSSRNLKKTSRAIHARPEPAPEHALLLAHILT